MRCIANTHLKKDEIIEANNFSFLAIGGGCIPYLIANLYTVPCARVENLGGKFGWKIYIPSRVRGWKIWVGFLGGFSGRKIYIPSRVRGWVFWAGFFNTVSCARVGF